MMSDDYCDNHCCWACGSVGWDDCRLEEVDKIEIEWFIFARCIAGNN